MKNTCDGMLFLLKLQTIENKNNCINRLLEITYIQPSSTLLKIAHLLLNRTLVEHKSLAPVK